MTHDSRRGPSWFWLLLLASLLLGGLWTRVRAQDAADDQLEDYRLGIGFYERERYRQAVESLQKFLKSAARNPKAENARFVLGLSYLRLDEFQTARETFQKFAAEYPQARRLAQARYWIGHCSFQLKDYAAAEAELSSFAAGSPADPYLEHALPYLGEAQLKRKRPEAALASFEKAIEKFPQGAMVADARYGRGRALEALQRTADALEAYRLIAEEPGNEYAPDARLSRGTLFFEQKQYPESIAEFAAYERQFPQGAQLAQARLNRSYALYETGEYAAAERLLKSLAGDPLVAADATLWLGLSLKKQQKYRPASETLEAGYKKFSAEPQAEQLLYQWADCRLQLADYDAAREVFEQLFDRFPRGALREEALNAATICAVNAGRLAVAEKLLKQYGVEFPQGRLRLRQAILGGRVQLLQGVAAEGESRRDEARAFYAQAASGFAAVVQESEIESTKQQARFLWGEACLKLADYSKVLEVTQSLADVVQRERIPGDFVDVLVQRGVAHLELARKLAREAADRQSPVPVPEIAAECQAARDSVSGYLAGLPRGPLAPQAWYVSAVANALEGRKTESLTSLQLLAKQFEKQPERELALLDVGEIAYSRGDFSLAESLYDELAGVSHNARRRPQALADLGWSRSQQKKHLEAVTAFRQLLNEFPEHALAPEAAFMVGQSLAAAGRKSEAQQAFQEAFARPGESDQTFQAGWRSARLLFELNDPQSADKAYAALHARFPRHSRADAVLDDWATRHYDQDRFERSDQLYRQLAEEYPQSPLAWNARVILAESALIAERPQAAREQFREIVANPQADQKAVERSLYQLQNIAHELQDWADLKRLADESLRRYPEGAYRHEATLQRAEADFMLGDILAARSGLERLHSLKNEPQAAESAWMGKVFVRLAELLVREKEYQRALAAVDEMEAWDPDSPLLYKAWEIAGRAYKNQARFDDARRLFLKAIDDPQGRKTETAARAQLLLADTYVLQKDYETALDEYLKVDIGYQFPYWQSAALYHAGTCQEALNDPAAALKTYTRLLTRFPDSELAPKAKERLQAVRKTGSAGIGPRTTTEK